VTLRSRVTRRLLVSKNPLAPAARTVAHLDHEMVRLGNSPANVSLHLSRSFELMFPRLMEL